MKSKYKVPKKIHTYNFTESAKYQMETSGWQFISCVILFAEHTFDAIQNYVMSLTQGAQENEMHLKTVRIFTFTSWHFFVLLIRDSV